MTAPKPASALADLALASGCSAKTFASIFGGNADLSEYRGFVLRWTSRGWTATRNAKVLRSETQGGIYDKVDRATARRSLTMKAA